MRAICIIPGRGNSRRIPLKNIKMFHGKPIIAYSIITALASGMFEDVYVSTDSAKIAVIARAYGAKVIDRPCALAEDHIGTQHVIRDAIIAIGAQLMDLVCCIYPTSPMLTVNDLHRGRLAMARTDLKFAFSVGTLPLHDAGAMYWGRPWAFVDNFALFDQHSAMIPLPAERVQDINTPADWKSAELKYAAWKGIK